MSVTKPGAVTLSLRTAPPVRSDCSTRTTSQPASARALAATRPLGPAPMTTASAVVTAAGDAAGETAAEVTGATAGPLVVVVTPRSSTRGVGPQR